MAIILLACGPCVVIVNCWDRFCTLGRAPHIRETLPDIHEWCRVTRHPRIFCRLTDCQRTLGFRASQKLLNISCNKFSWMIPKSLGYLENIETLGLSHNNIFGSIPPTLTKLQQLTILDVSNNELRGRIPNGGKMGARVLDPHYFANNSWLCSIQIRLPCSEDDGLPLPSPPPTNTHESSFLWKGVWIGYPIGLLLTIGIMVFIGYFTLPPPSNRQHHSNPPIRGQRRNQTSQKA